jgi:membrane protein YqaA with SNARE-associated domain
MGADIGKQLTPIAGMCLAAIVLGGVLGYLIKRVATALGESTGKAYRRKKRSWRGKSSSGGNGYDFEMKN